LSVFHLACSLFHLCLAIDPPCVFSACLPHFSPSHTVLAAPSASFQIYLQNTFYYLYLLQCYSITCTITNIDAWGTRGNTDTRGEIGTKCSGQFGRCRCKGCIKRYRQHGPAGNADTRGHEHQA
jgi:hypothetical protein